MTIQPLTAPRLNGESAPVTMTFILDGPDATVVADRLASVLNESANAWPATEVTVHHPDVIPDVIVDLAAREVYVESERVHLTRREFDLLLHLTQHPGIAFTRLQLLRMVWQHEYSGERTVDVHVRRLRVKLGVHGAQITTLHGFGYRLEPGGRFTTRLRSNFG